MFEGHDPYLVALSLAIAILGGYTGYVNFGTAAFFALGAYTTVVLHKLTALPLPVTSAIARDEAEPAAR